MLNGPLTDDAHQDTEQVDLRIPQPRILHMKPVGRADRAKNSVEFSRKVLAGEYEDPRVAQLSPTG